MPRRPMSDSAPRPPTAGPDPVCAVAARLGRNVLGRPSWVDPFLNAPLAPRPMHRLHIALYAPAADAP